MASFEVVAKYADADIKLPTCQTVGSAGYDFYAAADITLPPYENCLNSITIAAFDKDPEGLSLDQMCQAYSLKEVSELISKAGARPVLVPTGVKCKLDDGTFLMLASRSSFPLKHLIILANSVGIVDKDYYNNPSNEGHIYFQLLNMSPVAIKIKKGEPIGQGIIMPYLKTDNKTTLAATRLGGFGSTDA